MKVFLKKKKKKRLNKSLREKFKPEFLNRIDEIIMFKPLTLEELKSIVNIQISSLQKRLLEQNIELELSR